VAQKNQVYFLIPHIFKTLKPICDF